MKYKHIRRLISVTAGTTTIPSWRRLENSILSLARVEATTEYKSNERGKRISIEITIGVSRTFHLQHFHLTSPDNGSFITIRFLHMYLTWRTPKSICSLSSFSFFTCPSLILLILFPFLHLL